MIDRVRMKKSVIPCIEIHHRHDQIHTENPTQVFLNAGSISRKIFWMWMLVADAGQLIIDLVEELQFSYAGC